MSNQKLIERADELLTQKLIIPNVWRVLGKDVLEHPDETPYSFGVVLEDKRDKRKKFRVFWYSDCNQLGIVELSIGERGAKQYKCIFTTKCIDEINKKINDIAWTQNTC